MPRVTRIRTAIFCLALTVSALLAVQNDWARRRPKKAASHERSTTENELAKLRREIDQYRSELREHEQQEKKSKRNLSAYNRRTAELEAAITRLEERMSSLQEEKSVVEDSLKHTASSLDQLKQAYANSSRYLYMQGKLKKPDPNMYLFAPEKQSEYTRNSYYAHLIGEAHAMSRSRLDSMKRGLGESSKQISRTLNAEEQQIDRQAEEQSAIEARKREEAKQLEQIQQDKERLRKLLQARTASAKRLEGIIANLVVKEEAARKAREKKKLAHHSEKKPSGHGRIPATPMPDDEPIGRAYGPHSLSWPTSSHHIKQGFGEHRNATLNTVTMNLGIDIATPQGSAVLASGEGEVSLVSTLPSYGTIVVLQHSGGLHTVYADLSGANVRTGSHVRAGQQIGRSGSNEETGDVLHFEVWKGKSKQNPVGWLR